MAEMLGDRESKGRGSMVISPHSRCILVHAGRPFASIPGVQGTLLRRRQRLAVHLSVLFGRQRNPGAFLLLRYLVVGCLF